MSIQLKTDPVRLMHWGIWVKQSETAGSQVLLGREFCRDLLHDAQAAHHFHALVNNPHTTEFLHAVKIEAAHQRDRWGEAHDRGKSAENWFWLVGYLAGKCLRAVITGDKEKALHHTISSAAALANWYEAIKKDTTGAGLGHDNDIKPVELAPFERDH